MRSPLYILSKLAHTIPSRLLAERLMLCGLCIYITLQIGETSLQTVPQSCFRVCLPTNTSRKATRLLITFLSPIYLAQRS